MPKTNKAVLAVLLVLLLLLFPGCGTNGGEGHDDDIDYIDHDPNSPRDFIISDLFPYPGKKPDCTVLNKPTNFTYSTYIYHFRLKAELLTEIHDHLHLFYGESGQEHIHQPLSFFGILL